MGEAAREVAVIGAGVFGLATALRLARAGLAPVLIDEGGPAPNASAVAAGMLAPVSETLGEGGDAKMLRRLLIARDLWPEFAQSIPGLILNREGVDWLSADLATRDRVVARLQALGIDVQASGGDGAGDAVRVRDDWRLDPITALAALRGAVQAAGGIVRRGHVTMAASDRHDGSPTVTVDGEPLQARRLVVAAGYGARAFAATAPELAALSPIKGQLAVFAPGAGAGMASGPTLRADGLYLAPQPSGARAGATMEPGRDDLVVDPELCVRQAAAAVRLSPALAGAPFHGEAGVRAATPDGWPLAGPSAAPGVFLAAGARRNGWLLAPLVSRIVADAILGGDPHPLAQAFHPGRFTR